MKKVMTAVFLLAFFALNITADSDSRIENEYWSWDNGTPQDLVFENYFFSDDGTFLFGWGRSGKAYSGGWYGGTYFYDAVKNTIIFNVTGEGRIGLSKENDRAVPKELKIYEFIGEELVRVDAKAGHEKNAHHLFDGVMKRSKGRIKEQTWTRMSYNTADEIYFDPQGNCFFIEGKQSPAAASQYECEYNISGGILFLKVKSASIKKPGTKNNEDIKYEPAVKTYIRLGRKDGNTAEVEKIGFESALGGSRNWDYVDGEYKIKNKLPAVKQKDFYIYKIEKKSQGNVSSLDETFGEVTIY